MCNYFNSLTILFCLISTITFSPVKAQQNKNSRDSSAYVNFIDLSSKIESKYQVHLFYKPEWFVNKTFPIALLDLPLEECLLRIKRLSNLTYVIVDQISYIFVPIETRHDLSNGSDNSDVLLIGNPNEFGKYSKATIDGKLVDGKTGDPLIGAVINIEKLKFVTITDQNGVFNIIVPVGEYDVKLSYVGYEDNLRKIKVLSNGKANLELFEKSFKINEVVITAERAEFNVTRTQMSVVRLDAKNIKELPVSLGEKDIIKSVTLMPGVQSTGEFGTGFFVRGGSSDQNLILVEDVPLFNSSHVFGLISAINPDGVTGITLLKAGIPAKYGERASSVMDIRLGGSNSGNVQVKGGIGLLNSRLNLEVPLFKKKASLILGVRNSYSNWLLHQMPDLDLMNSSAGFYDVNGLFTFNFNSKNKITLFGYYSDDKFSFSKNTHYQYGNAMASFRLTHVFNKYLSTSLLLGASRYKYNINEIDTIRRSDAYQIKSTTTYHNLKWNFAWIPSDFHSFDIGINTILYQIMPGDLSPYGAVSEIQPKRMPSEKGIELAAYISDNINISSEFSTEVGLRYTRYAALGPGSVFVFQSDYPKTQQSITNTLLYQNNQIIKWYPALEPRIAFRYSINEYSSLKASYNRTNQFINLISNTTVVTPTDVWKLSSPNLKPHTCDQYALGYFRNFNNNTLETSVELYYKTLKNVIEYKNGAKILLNEFLETELLDASGYNYGIEFYLKKNSGRLTGWASYTFSKTMRHTTGSSVVEQINGNRYFSSPSDKPNNLILVGNYHISRRWRFSGLFTFNTGRPITLPELKYQFDGNQLIYYSDRNKYRLPDYHRLDISITLDESLRLKKKWKGSWTLSIVNLYGRKNAYSVYYKKETPSASNNYQLFSLYKMYIIGIPLPTLTYNFIF